MTKLIHSQLSNKVLSLAFAVHNYLGPGLLECCYEGGLVVELQRAGIPFSRQHVYPLCYKGENVGGYIADLVVDNTIILELKSVQCLLPIHAAQVLNYLRLSGLPVGYLMNFNFTRLEWKRFVFKRE